jgi:uncharacterized protein YndB with AHSA1/START domain
MSQSEKSTYIYVSYIRTTPEKLWSALTSPEFMRQYWLSAHIESDWKKGSAWTLYFNDGGVADRGEILEIDPPRRLVLSWRHEWKPELKAEGEARCVMELEPLEGAVKLTITHSIGRADSQLIQAVSGGWPLILSNLKSLLETGAVVLKTKPAAG